ncbi:hypothetical protein DL768_002450 [Monosporascus sp. mg162]|nr:hypothetical protein DL768_002450 [Monosporascus sp. mg162]
MRTAAAPERPDRGGREAGKRRRPSPILTGASAKPGAGPVAIPPAVLGGTTTFPSRAVAASGIAIIARGVPLDRRDRPILTPSLSIGYGATLVPEHFSHVFSYGGEDRGLRGFPDATEPVTETGSAITAFVSMILNLTLPEQVEETDEKLVDASRPASKKTAEDDRSIDNAVISSSTEERRYKQ